MTPAERMVVTELRRILLELMLLAFATGAAFTTTVIWLLRL